MASASGSGTVTSTYTPEASDKSTKIVFIQVMREILDGVPSKPSESDPGFTYQDADTTADFYQFDYVSGEKDPYYSGARRRRQLRISAQRFSTRISRYRTHL
jgi:hypothetical protein